LLAGATSRFNRTQRHRPRAHEFFKLVQANTAPGAPIPPLATTDGLHFDRRPTPEERAALLAYLRKL
jgi:hypothetical protein